MLTTGNTKIKLKHKQKENHNNHIMFQSVIF